MKFLSFIVLLLLLLPGCVDKVDKRIGNEIISVNPKIDDFIVASDIIEKIDIVPLETNKNSVLGGIDKIIFHNGYYYILDRRKQKALFIFDRYGKFAYKVGAIGRGPGEYIDPADFILNKNSKIEILCRLLQKKIIFDLDGKFLSEEKINIHATKFQQLSSGVYAYYHYKPEHNNLKYHLFVINESEGFTKNYLPQNDAFIFASDHQNFETHDNQTYFTKSFDRYIYVVNTNDFQPKYEFDFQSHFIEESVFKRVESTQEKIKILNSIPAITGISTYNFFSNHLFFVYIYDRTYRFNFYNLIDKTLKSYAYIKNDINDIPLERFLPLEYLDSNKLVLSVPAHTLIKTFNSDTIKKNYLNIKDIDEADNPVLLIVKLKDTI